MGRRRLSQDDPGAPGLRRRRVGASTYAPGTEHRRERPDVRGNTEHTAYYAQGIREHQIGITRQRGQGPRTGMTTEGREEEGGAGDAGIPAAALALSKARFGAERGCPPRP